MLHPGHKPKVFQPPIKKGVTTGMRLIQPVKKDEDLNLDLTIQADINEELQADEEGKTNLFQIDPFIENQDLNYLDGVLSTPNINLEQNSRQPIRSRMIGEIR